MRVEFRFHVPIRDRPRALHPQLLEQECERLLEIGADARANVLGQVPEATLERADRLLATLVEELLLAVALFALFFAIEILYRKKKASLSLSSAIFRSGIIIIKLLFPFFLIFEY